MTSFIIFLGFIDLDEWLSYDKVQFGTREVLFAFSFCLKKPYFYKMAKDLYHGQVKRALIKDGWGNFSDPYLLRKGRIGYEIDLGAENLIAASKGIEKIAVEIKSFVSPSKVNEFHKAIGQFNDYSVALEMIEPERDLYLAIPDAIYQTFCQEEFIERALQRVGAKLILFEPTSETITQWIK